MRAIPQRRDGTKYDVILDEPHSLAIFLSGVHRDICIVEGRVQATPLAYDLIGSVTQELTRGFKKVRGYAIGPEAHDLAKNHRYLPILVLSILKNSNFE